MIRSPALSLALPALLMWGCPAQEGTRTEIIVAVDTDLDVPAELDGIRIEMTGPGGEIRQAMGPLPDATALPATVGMVYRDGPLGPVQVEVRGKYMGTDPIQRNAVVDFIRDQTVVLHIVLARECLGIGCSTDETCAPGGCRPTTVDPSELLRWNGPIGRIDAGVDTGPDAEMDACTPMIEICNGLDDDCDGMPDEDFDLQTDTENCGSCGMACPTLPLNGTRTCVAGVCGVRCDPSFLDCNTMEYGCESSDSAVSTCGSCATACSGATPFCDGATSTCAASCSGGLTDCGMSCVDTTSDASHCGACDAICPGGAHATTTCAASTCSATCDPGFGDCDGMMGTGCETPLDQLSHCGACSSTCTLAGAVETCASGTCDIASCEGTFADCDMIASNGCEADLSTTSDCLTCGNVCPEPPMSGSGTAVCDAAGCDLTCDPGFGDCNGSVADGCEASLSATATCGSCGVSCSASLPVCTGTPMTGYGCTNTCMATSCGTTCTDINSDPLHCGMCDNVCMAAPQASGSCATGTCGLLCDPGFEDCNMAAGDGCEANLASLSDCGTCGAACAPANATGACSAGICSIGACDPGWGDCNGNATDGCERDLTTPTDCGGCGITCGAGGPNVLSNSCTMGVCTLVCAADWGNCNGDTTDGCEQDLTHKNHCGACGNRCPMRQFCCGLMCSRMRC